MVERINRQAELFGLKWSDLKWNSGTLYVRRQVQRVSGIRWNFVEPKTNAGRRTLKLGEETLHMLRLHKEQQALQKLVAGKYWQENDLIFPSSVGTPGDPSNLGKDFIRILMDASLPVIRFHDLRHTAASLRLNLGIPIIVVSRRLGHAKASITLDIYGHLLHEMQDEAARLMDELVTPQPVNLSILRSVARSNEVEDE